MTRRLDGGRPGHRALADAYTPHRQLSTRRVLMSAGRSFHVNVEDLLEELEAPRVWFLSKIHRRCERLSVLPYDSRGRPVLLQDISTADAIVAELESLSAPITGCGE